MVHLHCIDDVFPVVTFVSFFGGTHPPTLTGCVAFGGLMSTGGELVPYPTSRRARPGGTFELGREVASRDATTPDVPGGAVAGVAGASHGGRLRTHHQTPTAAAARTIHHARDMGPGYLGSAIQRE